MSQDVVAHLTFAERIARGNAAGATVPRLTHSTYAHAYAEQIGHDCRAVAAAAASGGVAARGGV